MAKSKNRPKFKVKKKIKNIQKQKQREMQNLQEKGPVTFTYHKDKETVEVPIKAWQMINQSAKELESIARFVAVVEQVGQQHMTDGTLLPVFQEDLEVVPGQVGPNGQVQYKIKDTFWGKGKNPPSIIEVEKPTIVMADGKTVYDSTQDAPKEEVAVAEEVVSTPDTTPAE